MLVEKALRRHGRLDAGNVRGQAGKGRACGASCAYHGGILPPAAAAIFSAQWAGLGGLVESGGRPPPTGESCRFSPPYSSIGLCCAPAHSCFLPRSSRTRTCAPPRGMARPDPSLLAPALPFAAAPAPALARAAAHASAPLARPRSRPGAASFEAFFERAHASTGLRTIAGGGRACCSACPRRRCCRRSRSRDFACRARPPLQPPAGHEGLESRPVRSRPDTPPKNMRRNAAGRRQRTGYRPLCFLIAGFRHGPHALGARPGGRPCGADSLAARTCGRAPAFMPRTISAGDTFLFFFTMLESLRVILLPISMALSTARACSG